MSDLLRKAVADAIEAIERGSTSAPVLESLKAALAVDSGEAWLTPEWRTMDSAPRDGSAFLVQYLPYGRVYMCMRRMRIIHRSDCIEIDDQNGWILVTPALDHGPESNGDPEWSIAHDNHNNTAAWRWREWPTCPDHIKQAIRIALGRPKAVVR